MFNLMERSLKPGEVSGETYSGKLEGKINRAHNLFATCWHEEGPPALRSLRDGLPDQGICNNLSVATEETQAQPINISLFSYLLMWNGEGQGP